MKKTTITILLSTIFLCGCSSDSGNDEPQNQQSNMLFQLSANGWDVADLFYVKNSHYDAPTAGCNSIMVKVGDTIKICGSVNGGNVLAKWDNFDAGTSEQEYLHSGNTYLMQVVEYSGCYTPASTVQAGNAPIFNDSQEKPYIIIY